MGVVETEKRTLFSECRPEEYESINLENSEAGSELVNSASPNQRDRVEDVHLQPEGHLKKTCHANRCCMKEDPTCVLLGGPGREAVDQHVLERATEGAGLSLNSLVATCLVQVLPDVPLVRVLAEVDLM